ncbi:Lead, cadmium, zinc and mercury transporting ATPase; Copper-translocating P-type ATPase [uncultured Leptolyngbya sp.]|uniref:Lead, cadmium, zinc and mercury transporting ATPase Copper-translocating P-type ATPase n=1 Tax=uncultured Leptolyngbya sp. TaxID=332963 RepID=A0A6J4LBY4_9CYAN|nr:Lead, cadmium, zinc and mercury transporting ATPase; Copper-translocating P-type ATPase [uncultured Leptolyngbya sp.]
MIAMLYPSRLTQLAKNHADVVAAALCGVLLLFGWFTLQIGWVGLALLLLPAAYVIGGYESAREGLTTLFQEKELDVDLLMIVAALGAAGLGLWQHEYSFIVDGATLILIFAVSGALEGYAMRRTERSIRSLMSLTADTARVLRDGQEALISVNTLQVGDRVLVRPGELIPTDGVIQEGYSTLNEAAITGESMPVEKAIGDTVFAGTLNGHGALKLTVHQPPESSLIQRVIRLVEQAQTETPPSQQFIERFERGYAKVIVLAGILLVLLPPFLLGWSWETTIYRALIFLVVASPCALMAATMPTLLSGIANGARQGILFKNGAQLELIGQVRAIAFDKTGTLTLGQPEVYKVIAANGYAEANVLEVAAALESSSEHPLGDAIVQAAQGLQWAAATDVQASPGKGIVGTYHQQTVTVGNANFVSQTTQLSKTLIEAAQVLEQDGKTVVWVAQGRQVMGLIAVADRLRPHVAETIARLRSLGIEQIVMLTGDNDRTAQSMAQSLGLDQVYANLLPEDKLHVIKRLQQQYQHVAMIGDGINDAPALAQASVGIAMGIAGSDVALETADIVLMSDRLEKLEQAITLSRRSQRVVKQNIVFAIGFILLLLLANFGGNITLPLGVIGHEGSTVLVTLSGLRLLKG